LIGVVLRANRRWRISGHERARKGLGSMMSGEEEGEGRKMMQMSLWYELISFACWFLVEQIYVLYRQ
jgi:hypothetical protein